MKHKKRRKPRPERASGKQGNPAWEQIKDRFRRIDRSAVFACALWFFVLFGIYTVCNHYQLILHFYVYAIAAGIIALSYFVLCGGSFSGDVEFNKEALPKSMTDSEKDLAEEKFYKRREWAKRLIPPLFGIILTLGIDLVYLNVVLL